MRAWRFHEFGGVDSLRLEEVPLPEPGAGEVLLKVERAALNPADRYMLEGQYPKPGPLPFSVGRDGCGTIVRACAGGRFAEGERVVVLRSDLGVSRTGTLAEYVAVPEESLAPLPEEWTAEEGAAGPLVQLTAYQALVTRGHLREGETVLVTGASGGVGSAAVVLARALGARVVALSRSKEKRLRLHALGADIAVDPQEDDWDGQIKEALEGGRVDLVVENLGGPFLQRSLSLLSFEGRIMLVGLLAGLKSEVVLGLLIHKCACIQGLSVSAYTAEDSQAAWRQIVRLLQKQDQRPLVDKVYRMEEVPEAFRRLARGPMGKVVIAVQN
jgi:NADPH:quinone reductase